jgi:hypothetical protein
VPAKRAGPPHVWGRSRDFGTNLLAQQRGGFKYRAMNRLFVIQLTDSRVEQRDYVVHPLMRLCRTDLRTSGGPANDHNHCYHLPKASRSTINPVPGARASVPSELADEALIVGLLRHFEQRGFNGVLR